jgi:cyclopropane fatty-acyl-phospholipid synthase-like methyltransferase
MGPAETNYCENCGSSATFAPLFVPACATRHCERCGGWHYFGASPLGAEQLYDRDYFFGAEYRDYDASVPAQRINFERKLRLLRRAGCAIAPGARVLELGCATGEFLALVRQLGDVATLGIEVSPYARERALEQGLRVLSPDDPALEQQVREFQPSFIVAWDVWEHLAQPATVLDAHLRAASPEVVVALTSVDASSPVARWRGQRWRQFHPPTHLNYPTRRSLRRFFEARSFEVLSQRNFGYHRPLLEYAVALGLHLEGSIARRWMTHPVYLNLYDTQLVIARRRPS